MWCGCVWYRCVFAHFPVRAAFVWSCVVQYMEGSATCSCRIRCLDEACLSEVMVHVFLCTHCIWALGCMEPVPPSQGHDSGLCPL